MIDIWVFVVWVQDSWLVVALLSVDPSQRMSAYEALCHPYFTQPTVRILFEWSIHWTPLDRAFPLASCLTLLPDEPPCVAGGLPAEQGAAFGSRDQSEGSKNTSERHQTEERTHFWY